MIGPRPMQLVVVMAVRKAVSAATITFTAISMNLFFIICSSFILTSDIRHQTSFSPCRSHHHQLHPY